MVKGFLKMVKGSLKMVKASLEMIKGCLLKQIDLIEVVKTIINY